MPPEALTSKRLARSGFEVGRPSMVATTVRSPSRRNVARALGMSIRAFWR